ncbi:hypothetical protein [Candidatus Fukatsuia endosymbiont of Tuberolachnus salignus]|uniref:hypothetical protein n=1 Tax=Candidatus Fukatsuia endosymbiont of Tuberolachnus salignus TaxID=3077957 RepID=UPI00313E9969
MKVNNQDIRAEVVSITDNEQGPVVILKMPALSEEEKNGLQRNFLIQYNGQTIYGRPVYQFPNGSDLSFLDHSPLAETPVIPVTQITTQLKLENVLKPQYTEIIQRRIVNKMLPFFANPLEAVAALARFMPSDPALSTLKQRIQAGEIPDYLLRKIHLKIEHAIREAILSRVDKDRFVGMLTEHYPDYDQHDEPWNEERIEQRATDIAITEQLRGLFNNLLTEPPVPLVIELQGDRWVANRAFCQADVGHTVNLPNRSEAHFVATIIEWEGDFVLCSNGPMSAITESYIYTSFSNKKYAYNHPSFFRTTLPGPMLVDASYTLAVQIKQQLPLDTILNNVDRYQRLRASVMRNIHLRPTNDADIISRLVSLFPSVPELSEKLEMSIRFMDQQQKEDLITQIENSIRERILPRLTQSLLDNSVCQHIIQADKPERVWDDEFFAQKTNEIINTLFTQAFDEPLIPLHVEKLAAGEGWQINRPLTQQDIGHMVAVPDGAGRIYFARIAFENNSFMLKASGISQKWSLQAQGPVLPPAQVLNTVINSDQPPSYNVKVPFSRVHYSLTERPTTQSATIEKIEEDVTFTVHEGKTARTVTARVLAIGSEENPLVELEIRGQLSEAERASLPRNTMMLREGKKIYGRPIYQLADGSRLSFQDNLPPTKIAEQFIPLNKLKATIDDTFQRLQLQRKSAAVLARLRSVLEFNVIRMVQAPPDSDVAAINMLVGMLPDDIHASILDKLRELTYFSLQEKNQLKDSLTSVIRDKILPRLTQELLTRTLDDYFLNLETTHFTPTEDVFIRQESAKIVRKLFTEAVQEPLIALRIERKRQGLHANRNFSQEDVGQMVALPTSDGNSQLAQIVYENNELGLKVSGFGQNSDTQFWRLIHVSGPIDKTYFVQTGEIRQSAVVERATPGELKESIRESLRLGTLLRSAYTRRLKLSIIEHIEKLSQPSVNTTSAMEKLIWLITPNLQVLALQALVNSGNIPADLDEQLKSVVDDFISNLIPQRLTQRTENALNEIINQLPLDYAQYNGPPEHYFNLQARAIIQQSLLTSLSESMLPLRIELQEGRLMVNRRFIQQDNGSMVAVPIGAGRRVFARVDAQPDGRFELKISGVMRLHIESSSLSVQAPLSNNPYLISIRRGGIEGAVRQGAVFSMELLDNTAITATVISLGDQENSCVLLTIPVLSEDRKRLLQRNVRVLENNLETYKGVRYQFADGTELSFPYPVTAVETAVPVNPGPHLLKEQISGHLAVFVQELINRVELGTLVALGLIRQNEVAEGGQAIDNAHSDSIAPAVVFPFSHAVDADEIAVVNPNDEEVMRAAGQWLREDQARRYLVDINGDIYSPNGNKLESASAATTREALRAKMASLPPGQQVRVLFLGTKQVFSSEIQWNNQSLADTREMISHFIHQHLNGVERVNLHVILGQIIVIEDLDANNEPLPRRSEVTIDYLAPLSASPTGNIVDNLLVVPPGAPGSTGLPGGAPTQLALLVQRIQDIDPSYSTAAAVAFLRQFNFPAMTRLNDYQTLLNGIQSYGYSLASIRPGQPDSQKYHSLTRVEFGTIVVPPMNRRCLQPLQLLYHSSLQHQQVIIRKVVIGRKIFTGGHLQKTRDNHSKHLKDYIQRRIKKALKCYGVATICRVNCASGSYLH